MMPAVQTFDARWRKPVVEPIRVMLVDDSLVARSIFARVLGDQEGIQVICEAPDAESAVACLDDIEVDIILLDIEMPMRSGLDALPDILARSRGAPILIVSAFAEENGPAAIKALSLGACDTLAKPGRMGFSGRFSEILVDKVVRLARSARKQSESSFATRPMLEFGPVSRPQVIAIGSSTGGIPAMQYILRNLNHDLDCPIFITQHLPAAFMTFFARQLGGLTDRTVKVAEVGESVEPNHVYVAPGHAHLVCRAKGNNIFIDHQSSYTGSRYCPSVDAMLESVSQTYGRDALAIILSGMGNDGLAGARVFKKEGAPVLVQDIQSSVVWGMPGAIAKEGLASAIVSPEQISDILAHAATAQ